jgi:DNA-binding NarL/FixJ family response regulator
LLELIAQGRDNAQIAITNIFAKIEVENRAQAIVLARTSGFGDG